MENEIEMGTEPVVETPVEDVVDPIGQEQIRQAWQTLLDYKRGKTNLEKRIIANEQWFKLRHWDELRKSQQGDQVEPASGWLFNAVANKHADFMDNFPSPNILPREEGDKAEAEILSSIVPVILEQNEFETAYDDESDAKLRGGTGVYGVFWDSHKLNGLGDITVNKCDILSLFWEPGVQDIQKSRNFFSVELVDNDLLIEMHPELKDKIKAPGASFDLAHYVYDDTVDTSKKSPVVCWYYKRFQKTAASPNGHMVTHMCKFCGDQIIYASENDRQPQLDGEGNVLAPSVAESGFYAHGLYPFVFDPLFSVPGSPCGLSYIDIGKSPQEYIDRGNKAILENMLVNASPRYFSKKDSGINEEAYADMTKKIIPYTGNPQSIIPVPQTGLSGVYPQIIEAKINELKEVTGNRDVSTGGSGGVTAASGIAAMQEAGSKLSRDNIRASYRAYKQVVLLVIELIRQFYSLPRKFRILGSEGEEEFVTYSNKGILPQSQGTDFGQDMGYRVPLFDIEVVPQKANPYSRMSQNELALQFYSAGFFNPANADASLACLDMMDFDHKQPIMEKIQANGGMYQQMMMMQQQMQAMAAQLGLLQNPPAKAQGDKPGKPAKPAGKTEALGGSPGESSVTKNAREEAANRTSPT